MLPVGPAGWGNSPYSCTSAFAGNVLMISLERLAERGYLDPSQVAARERSRSTPSTSRACALTSCHCCARPHETFCSRQQPRPRERFNTFCADNDWWLDDYALFAVLREHFGDNALELVAGRNCAAQARGALREATRRTRRTSSTSRAFLQFAFFEQWRSLRAYCAERGMRIIGDVAIFVSYDSADVWTHPDIFRLERRSLAEVVAGVSARRFQRNRAALGQSAVRLGCPESRAATTGGSSA